MATETKETAGGPATRAEDAQTALDQMKQQVAQQAQHTAGQAMDQARRQVTSMAVVQKDSASGALSGVAQALYQAGDDLQQRGQMMPGQVVNRAAGQLDQLAGYLRTHEVNEIVSETESLVRQQPAIVLGSAFALGFLASRFLKSAPVPQNGTSAAMTREQGA